MRNGLYCKKVKAGTVRERNDVSVGISIQPKEHRAEGTAERRHKYHNSLKRKRCVSAYFPEYVRDIMRCKVRMCHCSRLLVGS